VGELGLVLGARVGAVGATVGMAVGCRAWRHGQCTVMGGWGTALELQGSSHEPRRLLGDLE
jgi:hypothetical protein